MLQNIACRFTQEDIRKILDEGGLSGTYENVYVPRGRSRKSNLGYAFVQFTAPEYAVDCRLKYDGQVLGSSNSMKLCKVVPAHHSECGGYSTLKAGMNPDKASEDSEDCQEHSFSDQLLASKTTFSRDFSRLTQTTTGEDTISTISSGSSDEKPQQTSLSAGSSPYYASELESRGRHPFKLEDTPWHVEQSRREGLRINGLKCPEGPDMGSPWWTSAASPPPMPMMLPLPGTISGIPKPPPGLDLDEATPCRIGDYTPLAKLCFEAVKPGAAAAQELEAVVDESNEESEENASTVMLRNIACRYSKEDVMLILDEVGLVGTYSFVHVPQRSNSHSNLGYAFVEFVLPEHVEVCKRLCAGKVFGWAHTTKLCEVAMARFKGPKSPTNVSKTTPTKMGADQGLSTTSTASSSSLMFGLSPFFMSSTTAQF
jgi:RNA recognition motif-containing protein